MTHRSAVQPDVEREMWDVLDRVIDDIPRRIPGVDADAMRLSMTLHVASRVVTLDLRSRLDGDGNLTPAQMNVLLFTLVNGELELHRITRYANMKKATASALVNEMVNDGLLLRRSPPENRRTVLLSVSEKGQAAFSDAFRAYNEGERAWADALDPGERRTLIHLLVKLVDSGAALR